MASASAERPPPVVAGRFAVWLDRRATAGVWSAGALRAAAGMGGPDIGAGRMLIGGGAGR